MSLCIAELKCSNFGWTWREGPGPDRHNHPPRHNPTPPHYTSRESTTPTPTYDTTAFFRDSTPGFSQRVDYPTLITRQQSTLPLRGNRSRVQLAMEVRPPLTLSSFILFEERRRARAAGEKGDFCALLASIQSACKIISRAVHR